MRALPGPPAACRTPVTRRQGVCRSRFSSRTVQSVRAGSSVFCWPWSARSLSIVARYKGKSDFEPDFAHPRVKADSYAAVESASVGQGIKKRVIGVAVDDTADTTAALEWVEAHLKMPGDTIRLIHIYCDTRLSPTAVGASYLGRVSFDDQLAVTSDPQYLAYQQRLQSAAEEVVNRRAGAWLNKASSDCTASYLIAHGPRSAATIGEALCSDAHAHCQVLVMANHGPGVQAEYGSVARYVMKHARIPLLLYPQDVGYASGAGLLVAVGEQKELEQCGKYVAQHLARAGDVLDVVHIVSVTNAHAASQKLQLKPQYEDLLKQEGVETVRYQECGSAKTAVADAVQELLFMTAQGEQRCTVMVSYAARGLLQEAIYGSATSYMSRHSRCPLLLLPAKGP